MNLETIQSMWSKDAQIDQDNLHDEAAKLPSLHAKYFDLYNNKQLLRERSITVDNKIRLERWNYYSGKSDPEVYQAEPFPYKVREKDALKRYMDADEKVQQSTLKIKYYDVMLTYLEDIIKQVGNRSYQLKNIIDWHNFRSGQS